MNPSHEQSEVFKVSYKKSVKMVSGRLTLHALVVLIVCLMIFPGFVHSANWGGSWGNKCCTWAMDHCKECSPYEGHYDRCLFYYTCDPNGKIHKIYRNRCRVGCFFKTKCFGLCWDEWYHDCGAISEDMKYGFDRGLVEDKDGDGYEVPTSTDMKMKPRQCDPDDYNPCDPCVTENARVACKEFCDGVNKIWKDGKLVDGKEWCSENSASVESKCGFTPTAPAVQPPVGGTGLPDLPCCKKCRTAKIKDGEAPDISDLKTECRDLPSCDEQGLKEGTECAYNSVCGPYTGGWEGSFNGYTYNTPWSFCNVCKECVNKGTEAAPNYKCDYYDADADKGWLAPEGYEGPTCPEEGEDGGSGNALCTFCHAGPYCTRKGKTHELCVAEGGCVNHYGQYGDDEQYVGVCARCTKYADKPEVGGHGFAVIETNFYFGDDAEECNNDCTYCLNGECKDVPKGKSTIDVIGFSEHWDDECPDGGVCDAEGEAGKCVSADDSEDICTDVFNADWTGTYCCGDDIYNPADKKNKDKPNEGHEYYNDPAAGATGGCWDGNTVLTGEFIPSKLHESMLTDERRNQDVVNYKGQFHGCAVEKSLYIPENDESLKLVDSFTEQPLITNHKYCEYMVDNQLFCSYTEEWLPREGKDRSTLKQIGWQNESAQQAECCAPDECWSGSECLHNQAKLPDEASVHKQWRCIDGEWRNYAELKYSWDQALWGFCPKTSQCLINPAGNADNNDKPEAYFSDKPPQCIADGTYILDHFCDNGNWTTRSRVIALQLISLAEQQGASDYTVFCDSYQRVLNNYQYLVKGVYAEDYLQDRCTINNVDVPCVNNFCVVKFGSSVVFGVSLNQDIDARPHSFLDMLGLESCPVGRLAPCDSTSRVWYDPELRLVFHSDSAISLKQIGREQLRQGFLSRIFAWMRDMIMDVLRIGPVSEIGASEDYQFIDKTRGFRSLYIDNAGSRNIQGFTENLYDESSQSLKEYMTIRYTGFTTDICSLANARRQNSCYEDMGRQYVVASRPEGASNAMFESWLDVTSKLRVVR